MEIELNPAVLLLEETFNVMVAPPEMLVEALNSHHVHNLCFLGGKKNLIDNDERSIGV
jgi:hypothetical protein